MVMRVCLPQIRYSQEKRVIDYLFANFICNIQEYENAISFFCEPSRQELEGAYILNALRRRKPFSLLFSEFWRILPPRTLSRSTLTSFLKLFMNEVSGTAAGEDCDDMYAILG